MHATLRSRVSLWIACALSAVALVFAVGTFLGSIPIDSKPRPPGVVPFRCFTGAGSRATPSHVESESVDRSNAFEPSFGGPEPTREELRVELDARVDVELVADVAAREVPFGISSVPELLLAPDRAWDAETSPRYGEASIAKDGSLHVFDNRSDGFAGLQVELVLRSTATNEFAAEAFVSSQRDVGPPFDVRWSNARGTVHASSATWTSGSRVVIDYAFRGSRASEAVHERIAVTIP